MRIHIKVNRKSIEGIIAVIFVVIIISSIAPQTISLFTNGYTSGIDSGSTMPLDYEYSAAKWIKENTPADTVIISDPVSMEILSGLADRSPLMLLSMGNPTRAEDQIRLKLVYQFLTTTNENDAFGALNQIRDMGLTTEQFYHSFIPVEGISFVIVISQRTSIWIDSKMSYPVVYFNQRSVNTSYISGLTNSGVFELLNKTVGKMFIFGTCVDFFWAASSYSNSTVETFDPSRFIISFDNQNDSNFGIINGTTQVDGKIGKALFFNGKNDYAIMSNSSNISIGDSLTLEAWIKPGFDMPTEHIWNLIVSKGNPWTYLLLYENNYKQLDVGVRINGTSYFAATAYTPDDEWHYLVGTYASGKLSLYLDGISKNTIQIPAGAIDSNDDPFVIGALGNYLNYPPQTRWNGAINIINIYNRTLNKEEIALRYQNSYPQVAKLGSIEIPLSLPFKSTIQINATCELTKEKAATIVMALLDDKGTTISIKYTTLKSLEGPVFQNTCLGIIGPLNSEANYKIVIYANNSDDILVDKITGKIIP